MNTNFINSYISKKNIFAKHLMVGKENTKKNVNSNNKLEPSINYEALIKHLILIYFGLWVVRKKNENQKQHLNQSQETTTQ